MLYDIHQQATSAFTTSNSSVEDITDEQLLAQITARDEAALAIFAKRHSKLIRTIIARVLNNDYDVDEVLQDTLFEIWKQAATYSEEKGKALGWVITMARRRAIDRCRRRSAYARMEERNRLQIETQEAPTHDGADVEAQDSDLAEAIKRILVALPEAQRSALEMAFYSGLSQREIAAKTGIPLGTIKTRLELGVRKVRAAVLALGGAREFSFSHA